MIVTRMRRFIDFVGQVKGYQSEALIRKGDLSRTIGAVKASVLSWDESCKYLVFASVYGSKQVHCITCA